MTAKSKILFKEWLPDLPEYDNPGLIEANNVRPYNGAYINAPGMVTSNSYTAGGFPGIPWGMFLGYNSGQGIENIAVVSSAAGGGAVVTVNVMRHTAGSWATTGTLIGAVGSTVLGGIRQMTQYGNNVYISGQTLNRMDIPASSLSEITNGPLSLATAVVGQFLVSAAVDGTAMAIRWSSIGDPDDWPTPSSSTAIARQAGSQEMQWDYGYTLSLTGGDSSGIILQQGAITRMSYVGGATVFQFDRISEDIGCNYPTGTIKVGNLTYFISRSGFYATDGVSLRNISSSRVSNYFNARLNKGLHFRIQPAVDYDKNLIYWSYPTSSATSAAPMCTSAIIYSVDENKWSHASVNSYGWANSPIISDRFLNFEGAATLKAMSDSGTPPTATLVSGEFEAKTGGFTRLDGVKPLVDATVNAVTVALGTRNHLGDSATFGTATTANSRTGFADFRSEARYHRVKLTISGTFNAAQGIEVRAAPTGDT